MPLEYIPALSSNVIMRTNQNKNNKTTSNKSRQQITPSATLPHNNETKQTARAVNSSSPPG